MYDTSTLLHLHESDRRERTAHAASVNRAARLVRLRRLDRRVEQVASRARLVRLALG
jgi:hypothetical protein